MDEAEVRAQVEAAGFDPADVGVSIHDKSGDFVVWLLANDYGNVYQKFDPARVAEELGPWLDRYVPVIVAYLLTADAGLSFGITGDDATLITG